MAYNLDGLSWKSVPVTFFALAGWARTQTMEIASQ